MCHTSQNKGIQLPGIYTKSSYFPLRALHENHSTINRLSNINLPSQSGKSSKNRLLLRTLKGKVKEIGNCIQSPSRTFFAWLNDLSYEVEPLNGSERPVPRVGLTTDSPAFSWGADFLSFFTRSFDWAGGGGSGGASITTPALAKLCDPSQETHLLKL